MDVRIFGNTNVVCHFMTKTLNIIERKPIWKAVSEFYLDTRLDNTELRQIALTILDSPYSFSEVKQINKFEVFPVLQMNLSSVAGTWTGFDENWLVEAITLQTENKSISKRIAIEVSYFFNKWMTAGYWKKLKTIYNILKLADG